MADIVILGAGLTGLSAAYHLEQRGFTDYELFEKESHPGGLCRSVHIDGFTFDFTGHLLHTSDAYFKSLIYTLVGLDNLNSIDRRSFIYSQEVFTQYPFQINLFGLPEHIIVECIAGYVNRIRTSKKPKNFMHWVHQEFGAGFAKNFFIPFQRKIFSYDLSRITASWTDKFVPKTSLEDMLYGALAHKKQETVGYNAHFYYPKRGGIQFWVDALRKQIKCPIHVEYQVKQIDVKERIVHFKNGSSIAYKQLISTLPLDICINLLKESSSTTFYQAKRKLRCNSVINFNLGINRPNISDKHWIYFPEKQFPFYRVGFQHNFSHHATPPGCSSLYGEFSYIRKSQEKISQQLKLALAQAKKLFSISQSDVIVEKIISIPHAYVIYNQWREQHLPKLLQTLEQQGIYCIGRYGAWKYSSMQDAVLDGKAIAEKITVLPAIKTHHLTSTTPSTIKKKDIHA